MAAPMKHVTVAYEDGISYRIMPMGSVYYASLCAEGCEEEPVEHVGEYETVQQALEGVERHHSEGVMG